MAPRHSMGRIIVTEDGDLDLDELLLSDNSRETHPAPPLSTCPPPAMAKADAPTRPIVAEEDEGRGNDEGGSRWILPEPARPGDYLRSSPRMAPGRSILKSASSSNIILDHSLLDPGRSILKSASCYDLTLDYSLSCGVPRRVRQSSLLSQASSSTIGWDLDDPLPRSAPSAFGRRVSFRSVEVREYDRILGDNPGCRSGPPISLDWSYSKRYEEKDLDEYELERTPLRARDTRAFHMNKWKRRAVLSAGWGHTQEEMREARRGTRRAQRQRDVTLALLRAREALTSLRNNVASRRRAGGRAGDGDDRSETSKSISTKDSSQYSK